MRNTEQLELFGEAAPAPEVVKPVRRAGPADPAPKTPPPRAANAAALADELTRFRDFDKETVVLTASGSTGGPAVPMFVNEFWTARQRQANSLHEVSYRACFKPQLPRFFIERLTDSGAVVYDPFMGRGTTCLEAALLGRQPSGCDVNPLSRVLLEPRLSPPELEEVAARLRSLDWKAETETRDDLLVFYHPETLREICLLRSWLLDREARGTLDHVDRWIRMVAVNRLTGHSAGFFSVYSLPPNQAVSIKSQTRINTKRGQTPPRRDVPALILKKSRQLFRDVDPARMAELRRAAASARLLTASADATPNLPDGSVDLVVTSPPFLDVVDYAGDNWLRCWFCGIDPAGVRMTVPRKPSAWDEVMTAVFRELKRVLRPGGWVAFEVGEIRGGNVRLEESVISCARRADLEPALVLINDQKFTKTANCWGVDNQVKGTNTNRVVVLRKEK